MNFTLNNNFDKKIAFDNRLLLLIYLLILYLFIVVVICICSIREESNRLKKKYPALLRKTRSLPAEIFTGNIQEIQKDNSGKNQINTEIEKAEENLYPKLD